MQTFHGHAPPQYRFQAVQDGDWATMAGDYDHALDFYQQAIFSDQLEWWSEARRKYLMDTEYSYSPNTTLTPPVPDLDEYPNLAAYARYRIMLLHVLRGWLPEAEVVYNNLQEKYPAGQVGSAYAEMATAFWSEYQTSQDIKDACMKAIDYTEKNPEAILTYLGNGMISYHFGDQSLRYEPEVICPFK